MFCRPLFLLSAIFFPFVIFSQNNKYVSDNYYEEHYTDESGLPQNSIRELAMGSNGQIWLLTYAGLVEFDGTKFKFWDQNMLGTSHSDVHNFFKFPNNNRLFLCSNNNGIIELNHHEAQLLRYPNLINFIVVTPPDIRDFDFKGSDFFLNFGLNSWYSTDLNYGIIVPAPNKAMYLLKNDSVIYCKEGSVSWKKKAAPKYDYFLLGEDFFLWSDFDSLLRFKINGNKTVSSLRGIKHIMYNRPQEQVFFIDFDDNLYRFFSDGRREYLLKVSDSFGLSSILSVDENTIILGSSTKGLLVCKKKQFKSIGTKIEDRGAFYSLRGLNDSSIVSSNGVIVERNGLCKTFGKSFVQNNYYTNTIGEDGKGNFYFPQQVNKEMQINCFNKLGNCYNTTSIQTGVRAMSETDGNIVWFSTDESTLFSFDGKSAKKVLATKSIIRCIHLYNKAFLLLGADDGLYFYNKNTGRLTLMPASKGLKVRSINKSPSGRLFITTIESGLFVLEKQHLRRLPMDENGFLSTAHCIIVDKNGMLWITTNRGLFCILESELVKNDYDQHTIVPYYYISKNNGFATNEFNGGCYPSGISLRNGEVVFPSLSGVVWFDPLSIDFSFPKGKPHFTNIFLNDKPFAVSGDTLSFERDIRRLEFYFDVPFFGDKRNVFMQYRYGEDDWYQIKPGKPIVFSSLEPGYSTLSVRVRSGFNDTDYSYTSLLLYREPAIWETPYIWPIGIALFFLLMYGSFHYYSARLKKRNRQLEKAVNDAQIIIRKNMEELSESNKQLSENNQQLLERNRFHNWLISSIVHDIKGPLHFLVEFDGLYGHAEVPDKAEVLYLRSVLSTSKKIYEYSDRLIKVLVAKQDNLPPEKIDVEQIIYDQLEKFQAILERKAINFQITIYEKFILLNPLAFKIILHNILDNSIKNQKGGVINISFLHLNDSYKLTIIDEAGGVSEELITKLNNNKLEEHSGSTKGLGMWLIYSMVRLTKGNIIFVNTELGLCTEIVWPIKKNP